MSGIQALNNFDNVYNQCRTMTIDAPFGGNTCTISGYTGYKEEEKKGLSTGAKIGLSLAGLAVLGACLVLKGRSNVANSLKEAAKTEKFAEAKTYEEAKKYALDNFGMELELNNNVYAANFINEICYNVNKRFKGEATLPKRVVIEDVKFSKRGGFRGGIWYNNSKTLGFGELGKLVFENAQKQGKSIIKNNNYFTKIAYHELGHAQHFAYCKDANLICKKLEECEKYGTTKHYINEYLKEIEKPEVAKVMKEFFGTGRDYVKTSPGELVAETFAHKMMDKPIPKIIDDMYTKYGGRPVPPKCE